MHVSEEMHMYYAYTTDMHHMYVHEACSNSVDITEDLTHTSFSGLTQTLANFPKPVVTPYTTENK